MSALRWNKPDDYHIRSDCGRYSVCRITITPHIWYIAWRTPYEEIGATRLDENATDAERQAAIREMQQVCAAAQEEQAA